MASSESQAPGEIASAAYKNGDSPILRSILR